MHKLKQIFNQKIRIVLTVVFMSGLIGFSEISYENGVCKKIQVSLENSVENHFLEEDDIIKIVDSNEGTPIIGQTFATINLKKLESELEENPYIRSGEVYKNLSGDLLVSVELERPIARVIVDKGPDAYLTQEGKLMPISDKFVSRVMLIHGRESEKMTKAEFYKEDYGIKLLELVNYINDHEFWKAQIADLLVLKNGKIEMLPQVTKQKIEFGQPEEIESKLQKLEIFYSQILPTKGWNTYDRVNLEFKDQIIAE